MTENPHKYLNTSADEFFEFLCAHPEHKTVPHPTRFVQRYFLERVVESTRMAPRDATIETCEMVLNRACGDVVTEYARLHKDYGITATCPCVRFEKPWVSEVHDAVCFTASIIGPFVMPKDWSNEDEAIYQSLRAELPGQRIL